MKKYKNGAEIIFNQQVTSANKGERGKIVRKSAWNKNEYLVQPKGHNAFYTTPDVFDLTPS